MSIRELLDPNWRVNLPRAPQEFIGRINPGALDETLPIVDRIIGPQTIARFLEFAISGTSPLGTTTNKSLLTSTIYEKHFNVPYNEWAPGPHDHFSTSPLNHALIRVGSHKDASGLAMVEKRVHFVKSRLLDGIVPMSDNRWRKKDLDNPANHHFAVRHLGHVVEVFAYLQHPVILKKLTKTYENIYEHFGDFDQVMNGLPDRANEPRMMVADLWEEFITARFTVITTRAHSWVISNVQRLRGINITLLSTADSPNANTRGDSKMEIGNRIQDFSEVALRADYAIFMHLPKSDPPSTRIMPDIGVRQRQTGPAIRSRTRQADMMDTMNDLHIGRQLPTSGGASQARWAQRQREAQDQVRKELRFDGGDVVQIPPVYWSVLVKSRVDNAEEKKWGFAIYRLTYDQTDEEWKDFLQKLETDLQDWGDGEDIIPEIKGMASLHWFNGKDLGIGEGNIEAARKHFNTLQQDDTVKPWYDTNHFLVVDAYSFSSYMYGSPYTTVLCSGDTGGSVIVVEAPFDAEDQDDHSEEHPHYIGQIRTLGSLLYGDVFPLLAFQTQFLPDLWPMAMNHPELLYTGPTVKAQVEMWKRVNAVKIRLLKHLLDGSGNGQSAQ